MRKRILIAAALACAVGICAAALHGPPGAAQTADEDRPLPRAVSKIEGVALENVRREGNSSRILFDIVNSTDKGIVYFTVRCGAYSTSGKFDAGSEIAPRTVFTHRVEAANIKGARPLVLTAVAFADGEERGAGRDLEFMRRNRRAAPPEN